MECSASDTDGYIKEFRWLFGDGSSQVTTQPNVKHIYTAPGVFISKVTVVDNEGASRTSMPNRIKVGYGAELTGICEQFVFDNLAKTVSMKLIVKNNGDSPSGAFQVACYLSNDGKAKYPKPFKILNVRNGLAGGESKLLNISKTFTNSIYGKHILIYIDSTKIVHETDETNNGIRVVIQPFSTE